MRFGKYARSASGPHRPVKTALLADGLVKGLKVDVDSRDAVVTLTGEVKSQAERDRALQIARDRPGVKEVQDRLRMNP